MSLIMSEPPQLTTPDDKDVENRKHSSTYSISNLLLEKKESSPSGSSSEDDSASSNDDDQRSPSATSSFIFPPASSSSSSESATSPTQIMAQLMANGGAVDPGLQVSEPLMNSLLFPKKNN